MGYQTTANVDWPAPYRRTYHDETVYRRPPEWYGSLVQDKKDGTGLMYMRNRYYDPQSGQFTQEAPIGLAGGLNLYGFAGGDPVNFSDPFGLCRDANGNTLPDSECRQITAAEGEAMYDAAVASGDWTWTNITANKDVQNNVGDCTDYIESAMQGAGFPSLGTGAWPAGNNGAVRTSGTYGFGAESGTDGNFDIISVADIRRGDIVVFDGHAGIASGTVNANGTIQAMQNGGSGTGIWYAPAAAVIYRRKIPIGNE